MGKEKGKGKRRGRESGRGKGRGREKTQSIDVLRALHDPNIFRKPYLGTTALGSKLEHVSVEGKFQT